MELSGKIKQIFETKEITPTFKKREMVLTTEEQYPQQVLIEFVQDKTEMLDQHKPGDRVSVAINIRGREWQSPQGETKYFNSIQGWKINSGQAEGNNPGPDETAFQQGKGDMNDGPAGDSPFEPKEDDLPF